MSRMGGYRHVGMAITENRGNLGELKAAVTLKCGILTEIPSIGGRDFHPNLAKVSMGIEIAT
jgi:hypothetical protein